MLIGYSLDSCHGFVQKGFEEEWKKYGYKLIPFHLEVGHKIYFSGERNGYTVKALNDRFAICTKPYNPKRTVLYSIIDINRQVRGPNDLVFNMYDYTIQDDIDECMRDLESGETEVSYRRCAELCIDKIKTKDKTFYFRFTF